MPDPLGGFLNQGFLTMTRQSLRGVWTRGKLPTGPFVWAANHHSWWDPFLASVLLRKSGQAACLLMAQENLKRYTFLRRMNVFGSREHRQGLEHLDAGRVLVIFPEGELRAVGELGPLADGAAWFATQANVPLCAVATRVVMRGQQAPEAYVSFSQVEMANTAKDTTANLAHQLATQLSTMDKDLAVSDPRSPLPEFSLTMNGKRSWDERLDAMARLRTWRA